MAAPEQARRVRSAASTLDRRAAEVQAEACEGARLYTGATSRGRVACKHAVPAAQRGIMCVRGVLRSEAPLCQLWRGV